MSCTENNGITLTCDKFSHNELQQSDYLVKINNLQIINGGQTCMTLFKSIAEQREVSDTSLAYVLIRLYELPSENRVELTSLISHNIPNLIYL